jgi:hypothetical protein
MPKGPLSAGPFWCRSALLVAFLLALLILPALLLTCPILPALLLTAFLSALLVTLILLITPVLSVLIWISHRVATPIYFSDGDNRRSIAWFLRSPPEMVEALARGPHATGEVICAIQLRNSLRAALGHA